LEVRGAPVLVLQQVATEIASGAAQFSASDEGSLFFVRGDVAAAVNRAVRVDREGSEEELGLPANRYFGISLSPDDRRLALVATTGVGTDVWVADLERDGFSRLTFDASADFPVWSHDGAWIAYSAVPPGTTRGDIFRRPADGSGAAEVLWSLSAPLAPVAFSPDGKLLLAEQQMMPSARSDLWVVPLDGSGQPYPFTQTPFEEFLGEFSPDGRFVVYQSNESGQDEVYVRSFPDAGGRWQVSTGGGSEPRWSRDGREIFYRSQRKLYAVAVDTTAGFTVGRATSIAPGYSTGITSFSYSVSSDGRHVYFVKDLVSQNRAAQATLLLNWAAEVERLVAR